VLFFFTRCPRVWIARPLNTRWSVVICLLFYKKKDKKLPLGGDELTTFS
jgi:hypothetical protein